MHIEPGNSGFQFVNDCDLSVENRLINGFLIVGKKSRDGETARDVGCIAVVFGTHVEEGHVCFGEEAGVGSTGVSVVENVGFARMAERR